MNVDDVVTYNNDMAAGRQYKIILIHEGGAFATVRALDSTDEFMWPITDLTLVLDSE